VFEKLKSKLTQSIWSMAAILIVMIVAGPEIMISMELMALVEVLGASTFVIAYFSGVLLYFEKPLNFIKKFESHSYLFIPTKTQFKEMPSLIIHAIPERIFTIVFLGFYTVACVIFHYVNLTNII
jgi:hypothetical protein